jgi:SAM-dependent methyltransferase
MNQKILKMFHKVGMEYFFGDYFDARFYVASILAKEKKLMILDIGCGAGILLNCSNADIKIGLDLSFESLKKGKNLNPKMELIQGDATHLIPVVKTFQGNNWKKSISEIKRVSGEKSKIILTGANRTSKYFENTHSLESRKNYLTYKEQAELFREEFQVKVEGYGPFSKMVMYPFKIIYKIPEVIIENLKINWFVFRLLRSSKYLKNGRSYVIVCEKN